MDKFWLKNYPPGVPAEIGELPAASIVAVFDDAVKRFADRTAYLNMGCPLSFADLDRLSARFAAFLQQDLKLAPGARVALMMPNVLQYPVALFGVLRAGCVVVNVNPLYTPRELEHQLGDSGAETIVVLENFAHTVEKAQARIRLPNVVVTGLGDLLGGVKGALVNFAVRRVRKLVPAWRIAGHVRFADALKRGATHSLQPVRIAPDDIAFLQYTGGTTGRAKGAVLTHGNIVANLSQAHAWIRHRVREGEELIVTALPLYHIFSLTANCLLFAHIGATNLLITNPRDIPGFVKELGKHRFTTITGVNTLFNALLNHPEFAKLDFSGLRITLGGGMAVQHAVADRWRAVTGNALIEAYGLTETSPAVSINPLELEVFNHSIGLPLPSTEVSVRDDAGNEVPVGERGELCVRGPQVMREYWNRPQETADAFTADGYFRTGDIASMDERGYLTIVDRMKDIIIVSGFNVVPNEVEDVIASHPDVREVAVVGIQDERSGEMVKAFVVRRDPALSPEAVIAYCRENLTPYKVPHRVEFRDELPKTNVGKILRRALRDEPG